MIREPHDISFHSILQKNPQWHYPRLGPVEIDYNLALWANSV